MVIAWPEVQAGSTQRIVARRTSIDGRTWLDPTAVTSPPDTYLQFVKLLATDETHVQLLAVVFDGARQLWQVRAYVSSDAGATWSSPGEILEDLVGPSWIEDAVAHSDGRIEAIWTGPTRRVAFSSHHGLPGSWRVAPAAPMTASPTAAAPTLASPLPGLIQVFHDDYRDDATCPGVCESIYMDQSCDGGRTWRTRELRLDADVPPVGTHSEDPVVTTSSSGRIHVLWVDRRGSLDQVAHIHHLGLDMPPPAGALEVTESPATACHPIRYQARVVPESVSWCADPGLTWMLDGAPVESVAGPTFDVPDSEAAGPRVVHALVSCTDPPSCPYVTDVVTIDLAVLPTPVRGQDIAGLLRVTRLSGTVRLAWSDASPSTGWSAYSGTLAGLWTARTYDHAALTCQLPRTPPAAPGGSLDVAAPSAGTYYLIAPADCRAEGIVGADSLGTRRPTSVASAACGPMPE
jgi:hypothetical protein